MPNPGMTGWRWGVRLALLVAGMFLLVQTAAAQTLPTRIPGAAEPGRQDRPPATTPGPPAALELDITVPGGVKPPASVLKQTFRLEQVVLEGVTAYSLDELGKIYREFLGKQISFGKFYEIAEAIQARYHRDGYFLSFAFIPPQTIGGGVGRISIIEGFVQQVRIVGIDGRLKRTVGRFLAPVTSARPLRLADLERQLLATRRLAGVGATGILRRHETVRGASVLVLRATHRPVDAGVSINSRGSEYSGPWNAGVQTVINSLFGYGEQLSASITLARDIDELKAYGLSYSQPIGIHGLSVTGSVRTTNSKPGFSLAQYDTKTRSIAGDLDVTYPFRLRRGNSLTAGIGLSYLDAAVDLLGDKYSRDRIRTARASLRYGQTGFLGGRNSLTVEFTQGLPVLAATDPDRKETSRDDAEPGFNRLTMDAAHTQSLSRNIDLKASATGQYSPDPLPASQEFALGGAQFGRAFNSGEQTGERGVGLSLESGYRIEGLHKLIPQGRVYIYGDTGVLWDNKTTASEGGRQWMGSAGLGFQLNLINNASLRLEYAVPFGHTPSNDRNRNGRLFVFLNTRF